MHVALQLIVRLHVVAQLVFNLVLQLAVTRITHLLQHSQLIIDFYVLESTQNQQLRQKAVSIFK